MDEQEVSAQCKVRHCSQCQGYTEFYCHTCKHDLCLLCKEKHAAKKSTQFHHIVFYKNRHTTPYKVRKCAQCQGDTEFYCHTCKHDLCLLCKERHVIQLYKIHHKVMIYREKFNYIPRQEICVRHPDRIYEMFCQSCELSVCFRCLEHRKHKKMDIITAYQTKRQKHRKIIDNIRSETLYNCCVLLAGIQTDIQTCPQQICRRQSQMSTKAQRLKDLIDTVVCDVASLTDKIQQYKRKINRNIFFVQNYEQTYEQFAHRPVQFLLFVKKSSCTIHKEQLSNVISQIQMTTTKRKVDINKYLKLAPKLFQRKDHQSLQVSDVSCVLHISRVTAIKMWVCDDNNIVLTNTKGPALHSVCDIPHSLNNGGIHTVNSSGELIFIDSGYNIKKLSVDNKTVITLLQSPTSPWVPVSVYCSPSTGDLIVGMRDTNKGTVIRYNDDLHQIQALEKDSTGKTLYRHPRYITENNNGDIIASDWDSGAVVVTECGGRHRFSYTGRPSFEQSLIPRGICTDALSHILVCDINTDTVQMIDKDGHFLSLLLTPQHGINEPRCLNYDDKTHLLWVGSYNNKLSVYGYMKRIYYLKN